MYDDDEIPTRITTLKSRRKVISSARNAQHGTLNLFAESSQDDWTCGDTSGVSGSHQYIIAERPKRRSSMEHMKDDQDEFTSTFAKIQIVEPVLRTGIRRYSKYNSFFTSPESTLQEMLTHHTAPRTSELCKEEKEEEEEEQENLQKSHDMSSKASKHSDNSKVRQKDPTLSHRRHFGNRTGSASHCGQRPYAFYPSPSYSASQSHSSQHFSRGFDNTKNTEECEMEERNNNFVTEKEQLYKCRKEMSNEPSHSLRRKYHNQESTSTQEFPRSGLRRVAPPSPHEAVRGVKQIKSARGARQQIQVVNITPSYLKPNCTHNMKGHHRKKNDIDTPRTSIRCMPERGASTQLREALTYKSKRPTHGKSRTNSSNIKTIGTKTVHDGSINDDDKVHPLGKPSRLHWRTVNPTQAELFLRTVQDHAQQRVHGVTGFYVQLARNLIANVKSTSSLPISSSSSTLLLPCTIESGHNMLTSQPYTPPKVIKNKKNEEHVCTCYKASKHHDNEAEEQEEKEDEEAYDEDDNNGVSSEPWHIKHQLTLGSCRDQLVALTSIKVSVQQVAEMLWPELRLSPAANENNGSNTTIHETCHTNHIDSNERSFLTPEPEMRKWIVSYKDFARTFGGGNGAV